MHKNVYKETTWIDLENPTMEEVRILMDKHDIDPLIANEMLSPTMRPRVDVHENYIYLILHFPIPITKESDDTDGVAKKIQEVDFIIGKQFIITTHYESVDALHDFSRVFEVNSILSKSNMSNHAGFIFFFMIQYLYKVLHNQIETIRDDLDDIEDKIFQGKEKEMLFELSRLKRTLLTFKSALATHKEVLSTFEKAAEEFFGTTFKYHLRSIIGEYYKVKTSIDSIKEYLDELRNTNDSLLAAKQNEVMKILTIMAFVTFPLSLVAGIFGMNTSTLPFIGQENDFWIVIGIMTMLAFTFFLFFKRKKWL